MSVSSNSRKESTESNAAQQMHSTMGIHPDPMTAYRQSTDSLTERDKVADADWNRNTSEGAIPATRANEPDRTLGNS